MSTISPQDKIVLQGVKTHNLKDIDITIPKNKLITITGVSGSGKSSLAFHTIYKEGQFRYIESLSAYLRQFFNLGTRPDIDRSIGLSPAIAIEQNKRVGNSRSTLGTLTEIDDFLRLLFAKVGTPYSYMTGLPMKPQNADTILRRLIEQYQGQKVYFLQDTRKTITDAKDLQKFRKNNRHRVEKGTGFTRYLVMGKGEDVEKGGNPDGSGRRIRSEGCKCRDASIMRPTGVGGGSGAPVAPLEPLEFFYLEEPNIPQKYFPLEVYGIFDRITVEKSKESRLKEDIIKILAEAKKFGVYREDEGNDTIQRFTDKNYCPVGNIEYPDFTTKHFSFNRAEGACQTCHGIGEVLQVDFDKVIDPKSSYLEAILPRRDSRYGQTVLVKLAQKYQMNQEKRRSDLPQRFLQVVIEGDNEPLRINTGGRFTTIRYKGIEEVLKEQYAQGMLTVDFQAMLEMKRCPDCDGARLQKPSLHVFLEVKKKDEKGGKGLKRVEKGGEQDGDIPLLHHAIVDEQHPDRMLLNIAQLQTMTIRQIRLFLQQYQQETKTNKDLMNKIIAPLLDRIETIDMLGLGYLTPKRGVKTLSGGELQRLRLAKQLGNKLTGIIYVLDEPTIGLSSKEIKKTIKAIKQLKDIGNTIIVVEHNDEFIKASDRIVEIGPKAGDFGGEVVYNGTYKTFLTKKTLTAQYINHEKDVYIDFEHSPQAQSIYIRKASKYNLQNIDVDIPLGSFTIITGHSGAGKTTLMYDTLFKFLDEKQKFVQSFIRLQLLKEGYSREDIVSASVMKKEMYDHYENVALQEFHKDLGVESIKGTEHVDQVLYVDQTGIGKTPRSCPATFIGVFDDIRKLYTGVNEAKYLGFNVGHFSFNSKKGACPECKGYGYKKVELQFLPDTYVPCELCHGHRYKPEILDIKRKGKNIAEVLDMYVIDAYTFFKDMSHIANDLELMVEIGLGYLKMGQPAHTLSGGESQRLKLVKHLLKSYRGHTLYFLDEPTVGLHPDDINKLLRVLKKFLDHEDTILMIEHDQSFLKYADKVIELEEGKVVNKKV